MTLGTHTTPSSFFEEDEAANVPYSADTIDGGAPRYASWMEDGIEWIVKELLKDFKVRFVLFCVVINL